MPTIGQLEKLVGGLSTPSKMPGYAYGLPAQACLLGSILAQRANTVCSECYALKGCYVFPVVRNAQANRLRILKRDLFSWKRAFITLLDLKYKRKTGQARVFRWHDSGDIQSTEHLSAIVQIAEALPTIQFWLPTRERLMVQEWLAGHPEGWPANLTVRVSATILGRPTGTLPEGTVGSTVGAGLGFACPAKRQGNECRACRACWDKNVKLVDYHLH